MLQDDFSELENIRLEKMLRMRAEGIEPYPTSTKRNASTAEAVRAFETAEAANSSEEVKAVLAGRLRAIRNMGKLSFAHIEDRDGKVQLLFRVDELGEELLQTFARDFDLGDFIEAQGTMFRTRRGEVTLLVKSFRMLAKALLQLPADKDEVVDGKTIRHAALTAPETRFRQRYVDLAVNPETREVFRIRTAAVSALRSFLDGMALWKSKRQSCSRFTAARQPVRL
jgi:lysyl-tRNA synthetase class 2